MDKKTAIPFEDKVSENGDDVRAVEREERPGYQWVKCIGWIPEEWDVVAIGKVASQIQSGVSVNGKDGLKKEGEIGVLKVSAVTYGIFDPSAHKIVFPEEINRAKHPVKGRTILVSRANTLDLVGASALVTEDHSDLFLSDKLWELGVESHDETSIEWLSYMLKLPQTRAMISGHATGSSGSMKNISQHAFLSIPIPYPPLPKQRKIARILGTWDRALVQLDQLIQAKRSQFQGLMQRLLTGQIRFPEFEEQPWREVRIGEILKEINRPVEWDDHALYRLVSVRRRSDGLFLREPLLGGGIKTKNLRVVHEGDFLISRRQVLHGASGLAKAEHHGACVSNSYSVLTTRDESLLDIRFFNWLSKTPELYHIAYLSSYGVHIEKFIFHLRFYFKHQVRIPSNIEEQRKIVAVLDAAEAEIKVLRQKRNALAMQKKGLMQRLLTGQIRVKPDEQDYTPVNPSNSV